MKFADYKYVVLLGALVVAVAPSRGALVPGTRAITGVNVIPMTRDTVLLDHTVIVRNGRIVSVTPASTTRVPAETARIQGRGRWLIPGLADTARLVSSRAQPIGEGNCRIFSGARNRDAFAFTFPRLRI